MRKLFLLPTFPAADVAPGQQRFRNGRLLSCVSAVLLSLLAPIGGLEQAVQAQTWLPTTGTNSWDVNGNWSPAAFPNAIDATAHLNINLTGNSVINLNQGIILGRLNIGDTTSSFVTTTLQDGGGSLTFDVTSGNASINKATVGNNVTDTISATITLNDNIDITNDSTAAGGLTISGTIGEGAAGKALAKHGPGTLTLTGANTYTGATTINAGTLTLSGASGTINQSSGIVFNGGTLQITNLAGESGVDRVGNTAPITSHGGTFSWSNTSGTSIYAETVGAVGLSGGQLNFNLGTNQTGTGNQTLTLSSLTQNNAATATFSAAGTGPNATKNILKVTGAGPTPAGQIIGPWATTGIAANQQTDYAIYDGSTNIVPRGNVADQAETTWTTAANAYNMTTSKTLTSTRTITALRSAGNNISVNLNQFNLETLGVLQADTNGNPFTINSTSGVLRQQGTSAANLYVTTGRERITINAPIQDNTGALTLVKSGTGGNGTLILAGLNTFTGGVVLNAGTLQLNSANALGTGTLSVFGGTTLDSGAANLYLPTNNALAIHGDFTFVGSQNLNMGSGAVSLGTTPGTARTINVNSNNLTLGGVISDGTTANSLIKGNNGRLILGGNNTYTGTTTVTGGTLVLNGSNGYAGGTTISSGTLIARNANALGSGSVTLATNTALNYQASADAQLAIGGTLDITGGTNTILGGSIGSTATSAAINVTGAATINNAAHKVNVYGISGVTPLAGTNTYTLLQGGGGSSLDPVTAPTLNFVYNNSNFTVSNLARTADTITVDVTSAAELPTAYWRGGLSGATQVMSASNGVSASNWRSISGGVAQALVPGAGTDAIFDGVGGYATSSNGMTLGADMSIKSLTLTSPTNNGSDHVTLNADGYKLTIGSGGINLGVTPGQILDKFITINADVALSASQTWTNNINNQDININGNVDLGAHTLTLSPFQRQIYLNGAITGTGDLAKINNNAAYLRNANTYTGTTTVHSGTLQIDGNGSSTNTSAVVIAGGTLSLSNNTSQTGINRLSDSAPITTYGGNLQWANSAGAGVVYAETLGSVTLTSGQFNVVLNTNQASGGGNSQTLTLSGLNQAGTSAVTFSSQPNTNWNNTGLNSTTNIIKVTGASATPAGQIIGPWATVGTSASEQRDYAVYDGSGNIVGANIAGSAQSTWLNSTDAYTMGPLAYANGSNTGAQDNQTLTANRTIGALRAFGNNQTLNLAGFNLETNGILHGGRNQFVINGSGGVLRQVGTAPAELYLTSGNNWDTGNFIVNVPIVDNTGALTLVKSGNQALYLRAINTYSGGTVLNAGTTLFNNDSGLGAGPVIFAGGALDTEGGNRTLPNNPVTINANLQFNGSQNLDFGSGAVSLGTTPGTDRTIQVNNNTLTLGGVISNGSTANSLIKSGNGRLILDGDNAYTGTTTLTAGTLFLNGSNAYAGGTTINGGTLIARNAGALGSGSVSLATNTALNYVASADVQLAIGGTLSVTGGTNTIIGGSIGSGLTSAAVNVTGTAAISNSAHKINIFGISGVTPLAGTNAYTLLQGGVGSSLDPATAPTLNYVYNNSNFTVGGFTRTPTELKVDITSAAELPTLYWRGGLSGATQVMSASNGVNSSNWRSVSGGSAQALVPGAGTDAIFDGVGGYTTSSNGMTLGADMSIKSLTLSSNNDHVIINTDGYKLTVGSGGLTLGAFAGQVMDKQLTINPDVVLSASQTWTNNINNADLTANGSVDLGANTLTLSPFQRQIYLNGAVSGTGGLTKINNNTAFLRSANTYSGATTIHSGTLQIDSTSGSSTGTSAIVITGGTLSLSNSTSQNGINRLSDSAPITAYGGGFQWNNSAGSGVVYSETIGAVTLSGGQFDVVLNTNQASGGGNSQTLTLSGLNHPGTGAVTFSSQPNSNWNNTGLNSTTNIIKVTGASATPAGQIIGPWATVGTSASEQRDYAVYDVSGNIVGANIAGSAQSTWLNSTDAYTMGPAAYANGSNVNANDNQTLTADRTIGALRAFGHNQTLNLAGFTLETNGILHGGRSQFVINGSGGVLRQVGTAPAELYLTSGNNWDTGNFFVNVPIVDNTGALTLVKSGNQALYLRGANTYTGGTVLNAGTTYVNSVNSLGSTGSPGTVVFAGGAIDNDNVADLSFANAVTFNGNGTYNGQGNNSLTFSGPVSLGSAAGAMRTIGVNGSAGFNLTNVISNGATGNSIEKIGSGSLVLSGQNIYTGGTTLTSGAVVMGIDPIGSVGSIASSAIGTGNIVFNGGTLAGLGSAPRTILNDVVFTGSGTVGSGFGGGSLTFSAPIELGSATRIVTANGNAQFDGLVSGGGGLAKAGAGTLLLNNAGNSYGGETVVLGGTLRPLVAGAIPTGTNVTVGSTLGYSTATLDLNNLPLTIGTLAMGGVSYNGINASNTGTSLINTGSAILTLGGDVTYHNAGAHIFGTGATISGKLDLGGATRTFNISDSNQSNTEMNIAAVISGSGAGLTKTGSGALVLSNSNTYDGATTLSGGTLVLNAPSVYGGTTTVTSGTLLIRNGNALNNATNNVTLATNTNLSYVAPTDAPLSIGGTLSITGGTNTIIGGSIGSGLTSAAINVTGAATISNAAHKVNVYGINGTTPVTGTYTLLQGGVGSSLNPATAPTLNFVYNNTNFTVGALSRTATELNVDINAVSELPTVYWRGGLTGATNVMAASNGSSSSNWRTSTSGAAQVLVPGAGTDVFFNEGGTGYTTSPNGITLGADMSIKSLTLTTPINNGGDNVSINADGYKLTIGSGGINLGTTQGQVLNKAINIYADVALSASQTWTNNINNGDMTIWGNVDLGANTLTLSPYQRQIYLSDAVTGTGGLTKINNNNAYLRGDASYTGATTINSGTLVLDQGGSLTGTSGIAINRGALYLGNGNASDSFVNRVADAVGITAHGGSIQYANSSTANANYAETLGTVTVNSGQFDVILNTNQGAANNSQTLTLSGLNHPGTGAVTFSSQPNVGNWNNTGLNSTTNIIKVTGASATPAGQIIGPWATVGTSASEQRDYAVYDGSGNIVGANIAGSAQSTWLNSTDAYTMGPLAYANGSNINANDNQTLTADRTIAALRAFGHNQTLNLSGFNLETNGILHGGRSQFVINGSGGVLRQVGTAPAELYLTSGNNWDTGNFFVNVPIVDNTGALTLVKSGNQALYLRGANTYTGGTVLNAGTTVVNSANSLGSGPLTFDGGSLDAEALVTLSNNNPVTVNADFTFNGTQSLNFGTGAVSLGTSPGTDRTIQVNNNSLTIGGVIGDGATANSLTKSGNGRLILNGDNTFTGTTTVTAGTLVLDGSNAYAGGTFVNGGTLIARDGAALGSGSVTVGTNAALNYQATADAPLSIGGTLSITGGTNTIIGGSIGSGLTSAAINVTGAATISNAAHKVNVYGINGTTPVTGTYTLLQGGGGSSLNPATAPTLNFVYNNTNFTVGALSRTATELNVDINAVSELPTVYWRGGLTGATNVMAASNGSSSSNWRIVSGGAAQALIPGANTDVIFDGVTYATGTNGITLGADMSIKSLTLTSPTNNGSDHLTINSDGYKLTIGSGGINLGATQGQVLDKLLTINPDIALSASQTWTNNINNQDLTINGNVDLGASSLTLSPYQRQIYINGVIGGTGDLTKINNNTAYLRNANSYTGTTTINAGTLQIDGNSGSISQSSDIAINRGALNIANNNQNTSIDRLGNSAPITANGGNLQWANSASAGTAYAETIGAVTLASGQFDVILNSDQSSGGGNSQTLALSGLNQPGTGVVTFSSNPNTTTNNTGLNTTTNVVKVTGATATPAGQIIGGWATVGTGNTQQRDFAVYDSSGVILGADIAGSAETTWTNASYAYTMGPASYVGDQNQGLNVTLTADRTIAGLRNFGNNQTLTLGAFNLETNALLQAGRNPWTINASGGVIRQVGTAPANLYITAGNDNNNPFIFLSAPVVDNTGALTLVKSGYSNLYLRGNNTYSGGTVLNAGTTYVNNSSALGTGGLTFDGGSIDTEGSSQTFASTPVTVNADFTFGGSQNLTLGGPVSLGTSPGTNRTIYVNNNTLALNGAISNGATANSLTKANGGTLVLGGNNSYTGGTSIIGGALKVTHANGLGTGDVSLGLNTRLDYTATSDAPLAIAGALSITSGGSTTIGGSIGATPGIGVSSAQINVAGLASATTGAVKVNVYGIAGVNPTTGTYTLLHSANGGSTLNNPTYTLGTVFNPTNFTVGAISKTATDVSVAITSAAPLTAAYWKGGLSGNTHVWSASDGTANSNWVTAVGGGATPLVPGAGTDVFLSATSISQNPNNMVLGSDMSIKSLTVTNISTPNDVNLNADGSTLTIGTGGITMNANSPQGGQMRIYPNVVMGAAQSWTNNSNRQLELYGSVDNGGNLLTVNTATNHVYMFGGLSGAGGLQKDGAQILILQGSNSFSGDVALNAGTIYVNNATALGTGTLTIAGGNLDQTIASTIINTQNNPVIVNSDFTFGAATNNALNLGTGAVSLGTAAGTTRTISVNNNAKLTLGGAVSNGTTANALTKANTGTLELSGASSYSGTTTITGGTLQISAANNLGDGSATNTIAMSSGTKLQSTANTYDLGANRTIDMTGGGTRTLQIDAGTLTVSGAISGGGSLTKTGEGGLILDGTNIYTGQTIVNGGSLLVNGSTHASSAVSVANAIDNTIATLGGTGTIGGAVNLGAATAINRVNRITAGDIGTTGTLAINGGLTFGSGSVGYFDITGLFSADYLNVTGNLNASSGTIIGVSTGISSGTYSLIGYTGSAAGAPLGNYSLQTLAGGSVPAGYYLTYGSNVLNLVVANSRVWSGNGSDNNWTTGANWDGAVVGGEILHFLGPNRPAPNNNFAAGTTFSGITFDPGAISFTIGGNSIDLAGELINDSSNHQTINLPMALSRAEGTTVNTVTHHLTLGGSLSDGTSAGQLIKTGAATLNLTATNSYTAGNTVNEGTLAVSGSGTLGATTGPLTVDGGTAAVNLGGTSQTVGAVALKNGAQINNGTLTGASYSVESGSVGATLAGSGALSKTTAGVVTLSGPNTFNGSTTIAAGTINMGHNLALQNTTVDVGANDNAVTFAAGVTTPTLGGLKGSGDLVLTTATSQAATLKVGGNGSSTNYSGTLSGSGGLTKEGGGVLTLTNATSHSYAGATKVSAGTLKLQGEPLLSLTNNLTLRLDATAISSLAQDSGNSIPVTASGQPVGFWNDLSTANHDANVTNTSKRPTYTANVFNDKPALTFDSSNAQELWINYNVVNASPFTIAFAYKQTSLAGGNHALFGNDDGGWDRFQGLAGSANYGIANGGWQNYGQQPYMNNTDLLRYVFVSNPGVANGSQIWIDGVLRAQFTEGHDGSQTAQLALANISPNNGWNGNVQIGEVVAYSSALNSTDVNTLDTYLSDKWVTGGGGGTNLLPITTPVEISFGATLDLGGTSQQIASLTSTGLAIVTNSGSVDSILTISGSATTTFAGVISDGATQNISLVKDGSGTQILSGNNTYTGTTDILGGTLLFNGDSSAATGNVTVHAGGTLGGTGTVGGNTTILSGGLLAPGASIGNLMLAGDLDISSPVSALDDNWLLFELAGASTDKVTLDGTLFILGDLEFDDFLFTGMPTAGTYTLFDTNSLIFGGISATNYTGMIGAFSATLALADSDQDIVLTLTQEISAIPEPSTLALAVLGLGALVGFAWRQKMRAQ